MLTLAIDTTAVTASAALVDEDGIIAVFSVNNKLTHSQKLLPMIDSVLVQSGYTIDDVELLCVSAGPGSFTGVRIGIATIKGLAYAKGMPCVAVSALEALAYLSKGQEAVMCPVMDARRNEYYNALFNSDMSRVCEDRAISAEALEKELLAYGNVILNGDGAAKLYEWLGGRLPNVKLACETDLLQNAAAVGLCGLKKYKNGEFVSADKLSPFYLRKPQAEREYKG